MSGANFDHWFVNLLTRVNDRAHLRLAMIRAVMKIAEFNCSLQPDAGCAVVGDGVGYER